MSSTINADTTSGVIVTSDTSGEIKLQSAGADIATVSSTGLAMASGKTLTGDTISYGKVVQVVQTVKTDTFSTLSVAFVDITGLAVSITPSSASSKILVMANPHIGNQGYSAYSALCRDSAPILIGDTAGNRPRATTQAGAYAGTSTQYHNFSSPSMYLDSPNTTNAVVYKVQLSTYSASYYSYCNRTHGDRDTIGYDARTASTITVMEIAA